MLVHQVSWAGFLWTRFAPDLEAPAIAGKGLVAANVLGILQGYQRGANRAGSNSNHEARLDRYGIRSSDRF